MEKPLSSERLRGFFVLCCCAAAGRIVSGERRVGRALFTELDIIALLLKRMDADAKDTAESLLSAANVSRCNASF